MSGIWKGRCNTVNSLSRVYEGEKYTTMSNTNVFATESQVTERNKIYIIKRHFIGARCLSDAIGTVVQNAAKRKELSEKEA